MCIVDFALVDGMAVARHAGAALNVRLLDAHGDVEARCSPVHASGACGFHDAGDLIVAAAGLGLSATSIHLIALALRPRAPNLAGADEAVARAADSVGQRTDRAALPRQAVSANDSDRRQPMKTDTQIQQDVSDELKWEPSVPSARIGVEVAGGIVTLAGIVPTYAEKWNAERAAQRVAGVRALASELVVKTSVSAKRSDADIAGTVEDVLEWTATVPDAAVKVKVENGFVTLSGDVDWQYQKLSATASVRFLAGVVGVVNLLVVGPTVQVEAVKADIEAALRRSAVADAKKISVEIRGSDVTLTGKVHSYSERKLATKSAWGTPGVRNVVDKMTFEY